MKQSVTQKQALFDAMEGIRPAYIMSAVRREERFDGKGSRRLSPWVTAAACLVVGVGVWLGLLFGGALGPGLIPGGVSTETGTTTVSEPLTDEKTGEYLTGEEPAGDPTEEPTSAEVEPATEPDTVPVTVPETEPDTAPETETDTETEAETEPDPDIIASGVIKSCTWSFHVDGTLTIGAVDPEVAVAMPNFKKPEDSPWYSYRNRIKAVVVQAPITTVGEYAFYGMGSMKELQAISLPETMTKIESFAFGNGGFRSLDMTGWDYDFGEYVFQNCKLVMEVQFPSSITVLPPKMLSGCTALKTLTVPSNIKEIGDFALEGLNIRTLILEDGGVERIGKYACNNMRSLDRLELGDSLIEIGSNAFAYCTALKEIVFPDSLKNIGYRAFFLSGVGPSITISAGCTLSSDVFSSCSNLKELTVYGNIDMLPEIRNESLEVLSFPDVTGEVTISIQNFSGCTSLRRLVLGEGAVITKVGREGFYSCSQLEELPLGVLTYVGERAFSGCQSLNPEILHLKGTVEYGAFSRMNSLTHVLVDTGSVLDRCVFEHCIGLKRLWFAESATVGKNCFTGCPGTMQLYFPGNKGKTFDLTFVPVMHTGCSRDDFIAACLADDGVGG